MPDFHVLASAVERAHDGWVTYEVGDDEWDRRARNETPTQRLDRNWAGLLQELRVVQTGVQLLTGFLLTVPFQDRFYTQDTIFQVIYLITVSASVGATILLLAPASMHRILFRRHRLKTLIVASQKCALGGLVLLGVALTGVMALVFELVVGRPAGVIAGTVTIALFTTFWFAIPWRYRELASPGEISD